MVLIDVERLLVRNGRYYFRRKVPKDVRETIGKTQWKESLGLREGQQNEALKKIHRLNIETNALISAARSAQRGEASSVDILNAREAARSLAKSMGYLETPGRKPDLVQDDERTERLRELWEKAEERLLADGFTKEQLEEAREVDLRTPPSHPPREDGEYSLLLSKLKPIERALIEILRDGELSETKAPVLSVAYAEDLTRHGGERGEKQIRYAVESFVSFAGDLSIDQIKRSTAQAWCQHYMAEDNTRSPATLKRRVGSLKALLKRAYVRHDIEKINPFDGVELPRQVNPQSAVLPFSRGHLQQLERAITGRIKIHEEDRKFLLFLKYTGAINSEIAGLEIGDIHQENGIHYLWIGPNSSRSRLKTEYRRRQVPVADDLLPVLHELLIQAKEEKRKLLFPRAAKDTHSLSTRLNKKIRQAGVPKSPRLVCYSFRHGLKEALRRADIPEATQRSLLGHSGKDVADNYGSASRPLPVLKEALEKALVHLGDVSQHDYSDDEWIA